MTQMNEVMLKDQYCSHNTVIRVSGMVLSSACSGDNVYITVLSHIGLPIVISMRQTKTSENLPYPGDHVEIEGMAVSGTVEIQVMSMGVADPASSASASPRLLVVAAGEPDAEKAAGLATLVGALPAPMPVAESGHAQDGEHPMDAAMPPALASLFFPAEARKATTPPEERANRSMRPAEAWFGPMNERGPFPLYPTPLDLEIPV